MDQLLTDYSADIPHSIAFDQELKEVKQRPTDCKISFRENLTHVDFKPLTNNLPNTIMTDIVIVDDTTDEQDYYLAA